MIMLLIYPVILAFLASPSPLFASSRQSLARSQVGIPLMYYVVVWRAKAVVNPETLFVVADCLLDGAEVSADEEHRESACGVEVTAEMHALARMSASLHYNCHRLRTQAELVHKNKLAELVVDRTILEAMITDEEVAEQAKEAKQRQSKNARLLKVSAKRRFLLMKERIQVPSEWEEALPGYATVCNNLESSIAIVEAELVHLYREVDPHAQMYAFLIGAYEPQYYYWESIECIRRLALTGACERGVPRTIIF